MFVAPVASISKPEPSAFAIVSLPLEQVIKSSVTDSVVDSTVVVAPDTVRLPAIVVVELAPVPSVTST